MDLGRVETVRKHWKMKQREIAEVIGLTEDQWSKTRSGTRQLKLHEADLLRAWLADWDPERPVPPPSSAPRTIPVLGLVSAGQWREAFEENGKRMLCPDPDLPRHTFAVEVVGDSMDLVAPPGALLMVDPDNKDLLSGKYYIVRNAHGEVTFKKYMSDPARLEPCSSNPEHGTIYPGREAFEVIGRVLMKTERL